MTEIFAHRGLWDDNARQNTRAACLHAFLKGFNVEIDVRADSSGKLVTGHDTPQRTSLRGILSIKEAKKIALHVKEAGLCRKLNKLLSRYPKLDYFIFGTEEFNEWTEYVNTFGPEKIARELYIDMGIFNSRVLLGNHTIIWMAELNGEFNEELCDLLSRCKKILYIVTNECYSEDEIKETLATKIAHGVCTDNPFMFL